MKKILYLLVTIALLIINTRCRRVAFSTTQQQYKHQIIDLPEGTVKLQNPYALSNILKAYADMVTNGDTILAQQVSGIKPTHYYIQFFPQNKEEKSLLLADTTIVFYPYPLDVFYPEDFDIENYTTNTLYAAIPVAYTLPSIKHEIIELLFIPDEQRTPTITHKILPNNISVEDLVARSFSLTKNTLKPLVKKDSISGTSFYQQPSGRVTFKNNMLQNVGISNVKVHARFWFTTYTGYSNNDGFFKCNGYLLYQPNFSYDYSNCNFANIQF